MTEKPLAFQPTPIPYEVTLRDWFASQELIAMGRWSPAQGVEDLIWGGPQANFWQRQLASRAEYAYAQADAMLKARGDGKP